MLRLPLRTVQKSVFRIFGCKPLLTIRFNGNINKPTDENHVQPPASMSKQPTPQLSDHVEGPKAEETKEHENKHPSRVGATLHYAEEKLSFAGHYAGQTYEELEKNLMKAINESNQNRFRVYFIGAILLILWIVAVFGSAIRKRFTKETADIARETLENDALKLQTQEFALVVVQTILNDKEITAQAATFLKEASMAPDTQKALVLLTMHILQHEDSLKELTILVKKLVNNLSDDKETVSKLVELLAKVVEDPQLKKSLVVLVAQLCKEPEVVQAMADLVLELAVRRDVIDATGELLVKSSSDLLQDQEVQDKSRAFVAEVVGDDMLQREGGDALLNSVKHALKPGAIRMTGFTLIMASVGLIKILLSPY